jgi:hypothetical protein
MLRVKEEGSMRIAGCSSLPGRRRRVTLPWAIAFLLAGCGSVSPGVAGSWAENAGSFPGSGVKMTLLSNGTAISGIGNLNRDPGPGSDFTATGKVTTPATGQLSFHYPDGTSEDFVYTQPDPNHLTLTSATSALDLFREE